MVVPEDNDRGVQRRYGSFTRPLVLLPTDGAEGSGPSFDEGVLPIEVPRREEAKLKAIEIKASA